MHLPAASPIFDPKTLNTTRMKDFLRVGGRGGNSTASRSCRVGELPRHRRYKTGLRHLRPTPEVMGLASGGSATQGGQNIMLNETTSSFFLSPLAKDIETCPILWQPHLWSPEPSGVRWTFARACHPISPKIALVAAAGPRVRWAVWRVAAMRGHARPGGRPCGPERGNVNETACQRPAKDGTGTRN